MDIGDGGAGISFVPRAGIVNSCRDPAPLCPVAEVLAPIGQDIPDHQPSSCRMTIIRAAATHSIFRPATSGSVHQRARRGGDDVTPQGNRDDTILGGSGNSERRERIAPWVNSTWGCVTVTSE
jgi:hypothetical protein